MNRLRAFRPVMHAFQQPFWELMRMKIRGIFSNGAYARAALGFLCLSQLLACEAVSGVGEVRPVIGAFASRGVCSEAPYADNKAGFTETKMPDQDQPPGSAGDGSRDERAPFHGLSATDRPLDQPPEIARIRRGLIGEYGGGLRMVPGAGLIGVDLDRHEVVSVELRFLDEHTPGHDNGRKELIVPLGTRGITARMAVTPRLTEWEIVTRRHLEDTEMREIICSANALWALDQSRAIKGWISDAGISNETLRDERNVDGARHGYRKVMVQNESLSFLYHFQPTLKYRWKSEQQESRRINHGG